MRRIKLKMGSPKNIRIKMSTPKGNLIRACRKSIKVAPRKVLSGVKNDLKLTTALANANSKKIKSNKKAFPNHKSLSPLRTQGKRLKG